MAITPDVPTSESTASVITSSPIVSTPKQLAPARSLAPSVVQPLAPERYKVQFTIGPETHNKLRKLQDLMRHAVPSGDIEEIFDRAITWLLREVERRKLAQAEHPRSLTSGNPTGRRVPAAAKRAVWARDKGQCAFTGTKGRCDERGFLEFHHVIPFAQGGETTVENLQLRCRAHNNYEAREHFGVSQVRERTGTRASVGLFDA
jgi:hypothetical protein